MTLLYRTPLGPAANDYEFEWKYATPNADGTLSTDKDSAAWTDKTAPAVQAGLTSLQLGEKSTVQDFVNTYYSMRYRAKEGTLAAATVGTGWSGWTDEQLAEGWVQRVLNSVTPFAQRVEDFYDNPSDIALTMLEQIGRPYQGDVALNNDNLKEVGLLELYQTIFNKAESILIAAGGENVDLSKQLILATTRMGEFYSLLGAEAYSDAKNPLIGSSTGAPTAAGVFCFANQVPTLLDEELALLRGRTSATQFPKLTAAPYFNRLLWNFTKGITEGEVAYVNNYGIRARDGVMDVNCAAAQYPQGHGDAWGHYLSALTGYYRLLRNPYVDWTASMTEMLMDQTAINVDYQDEAKFADAAAKLAQVGLDAMSLTARKAYKENGGNGERGTGNGYFDADSEQAFGYGEWATRTGMGAAYNWMVANAITPTTNEAAQAFSDLGLKRIDREQNGAQMKTLCRTVENLQMTLGGLEGGLNPLGLSENAIPFDIDPDALAAKNSHFEQILERAEKALANCRTVLDWANIYGSRLAQIQERETAATDNIASQELSYQNQLIAIYGTPFPGDIGPGGTYPQGYEGPDIYNYNYMDLSVFGIEAGLMTVFTNSYQMYEAGLSGYWNMKMQTGYETNMDMKVTLNYIVGDGGIRMKPATVGGVRATEGSIQSAYRSYIGAYQKLQIAMATYEVKFAILKAALGIMNETKGRVAATLTTTMASLIFGVAYHMDAEHWVDMIQTEYDFALKADMEAKNAVMSNVGAGTTIISDPKALAVAATLPEAMTDMASAYAMLLGAKQFAYTKKGIQQLIDGVGTILDKAWTLADTFRELGTKMETAAGEVNEAASAIQQALAQLTTAEAAYRAEIYKGQMLLEERELWRKQVSNTATQQRYLDMFNRVQRNNALVKYSTAFDTAQRYVFELAKVLRAREGVRLRDGPPLLRPAERQAVPRGHHCDPLARKRRARHLLRHHRRRPLGRRHAHEGQLGRPQGPPRRQQPGQAGEVVLAPVRILPHQARRLRRRGVAPRTQEVLEGRHPRDSRSRAPLPAASERESYRDEGAGPRHRIPDLDQQRRELLRQDPARRRIAVLERRLRHQDRRRRRRFRRLRQSHDPDGDGPCDRAEHLLRPGRHRLHARTCGHDAEGDAEGARMERRGPGDAASVHRRLGAARRRGVDLHDERTRRHQRLRRHHPPPFDAARRKRLHFDAPRRPLGVERQVAHRNPRLLPQRRPHPRPRNLHKRRRRHQDRPQGLLAAGELRNVSNVVSVASCQ